MTTLDRNLKPIVGVSACLLGERVRYDGGHKLHPLIQIYLQPFVELKRVCPEVAAGLGVPRPTIQLQQTTNGVRAVINHGNSGAIDVSDQLTKVAVQFLNETRAQPLCGFIFKSRSPSCGLGSTPVQAEPENFRNGLFADTLQCHNQALVLVEDSWLCNEARHFRFLTACYLLFLCHNRGDTNPELPTLVGLDSTSACNSESVRQVIDRLMSTEESATLDERLCEFWRGNL